MPLKKKKGGAGKGKAKKKGEKAAKAAAEKEQMVRTCRNFLKVYQQRCAASSSTASLRICKECRECIENEKPLAKFILEPSQLTNPASQHQIAKSATPTPTLTQGTPMESLPPEVAGAQAKPVASVPPILLQPLANSWVEVKYSFMRSLHIWHLELADEGIVALALFLECSLGPNLKVLEIRDAHLSPWAIERLGRSMRSSQLTTLNLDYNVIPQPSLIQLCESLRAVPTLQSLSLNYCHLTPDCGEPLGTLVALSQIQDLSLAGNRLECEGMTELLRPVVALTESPPEGQNPPPLTRLLLQDNAIDGHGTGGMFGPVICMRAFKRWILSSPIVTEVNLLGNLIGDGGGREVMLAMQERKEAGLPSFKMTVTHRLSFEIFSSIVELSTSGAKKKKGKKKGKKGKKKA